MFRVPNGDSLGGHFFAPYSASTLLLQAPKMTSNPNQTVHADVASLNLRMLTLAREVARESIGEAVLRFGLDAEAAKALSSASQEALIELSQSGKARFRPVVSAREIADADATVRSMHPAQRRSVQ
jgi:hypothetical protein